MPNDDLIDIDINDYIADTDVIRLTPGTERPRGLDVWHTRGKINGLPARAFYALTPRDVKALIETGNNDAVDWDQRLTEIVITGADGASMVTRRNEDFFAPADEDEDDDVEEEEDEEDERRWRWEAMQYREQMEKWRRVEGADD